MNKNLLIATAIILLLSAFIGANFVYEPNVRQLKKLEKILKEEEEIGSLLSEVSSMEKELQTYRHRLMGKEKEELELMDRVREIANEVPVRVISMTPVPSRKEKENEAFQFIFLNILFEGTYHELGAFVAKIESSEKFIRVETIKVTVKSGNPPQPILHELQLSTLRQR